MLSIAALALVSVVALGVQRPLPPTRAGNRCGTVDAGGTSNPEPIVDTISADRPDITDSTDVVGGRRWQVEAGVSFAVDRVDDVSEREVAVPLAMVRVGIGDRFEARISTDGIVWDRIGSGGTQLRVTGGADLQLGAKWRLFARPWRCFVVALEPVLSLPTGSAAFTSGGYDPTLKVIVDRTLPRGMTLSTNLVFSSTSDAGHRFTKRSISGSLSYPVATGWSGFAELYHASAAASEGHGVWIADAGVVHPLGTRAQVDMIAGRGLSGAAPDWFVGVGFAFRLAPPAGLKPAPPAASR